MTKQMNNILKTVVSILFISLVVSCKTKEKSDDVEYLMHSFDNENSIRVDFYEAEKGSLIFYFPDKKYNEKNLINGYKSLLTQAKAKWDFNSIDYNVLAEEYKNEEFINKIIDLNKVFLKQNVLNYEMHQDGFIVSIN